MRTVIVGHGMVGHKLAELLIERGTTDEITILGEEVRPAYDRVHLSEFFAGKGPDDLCLVKPDFFARAPSLSLQLSCRATAIDRAARTVELSDGRRLSYDRLVLATGSYPFVPDIPGRDRPGCFVYRTIEDLEAIAAAAPGARVGVVIGGGLLGLEAARALKELGLTTHVVEFAPRLMAVQIDDGAARVLARKIAALGVSTHTSRNTRAIVDGGTCRHRLQFADGTDLEADVVVFSAGIRARDELARQAGLAVGARGGVVIDDQCRTSDPDIFAVGECACHAGLVYGLVAPGYQMAEVVADQICGREARFTGSDTSTKLKLLGVDVASFGDAHAQSDGGRCYTWLDERAEIYRKIVVSDDGKRLLGGILVGAAEDYGILLQTMRAGLPLPSDPAGLVLPASASSPSSGSALELLPESAPICSCNNVSKGALCRAIDNGATTLGALKTCTKAGTSCGGCSTLVGQVLTSELKRRGVAVTDHVCEHFPHSRQALYHLVRVGQIRDFAELLARHGRGRGCDVCKPLVGSILASLWNEPILARRHAPLQDTNDHFLANIQKDGTYSVVPRVPGGEITPEGLIAIGTIARRYGLYTKITGGQRIDLLGAQVHQLPQIWQELIDAGFESGHAYGKAVRTVKSCVGSTWCRYGVQDSTGLAILLEQRYRGLRAPHKIKFGVSGCTRECAEAQGKDIGVIATEKGWNLYVAGNGGMKPRHAELLAADLDQDTLVRTIDRFLMFYIRTADRLQRTATWLDHLEGGLAYVREVVCEDALGIAQELEADMAHVVSTYECEWKNALADPIKLRRFRTFVNSDQGDPEIRFEQERGQIKPAPRARSEEMA